MGTRRFIKGAVFLVVLGAAAAGLTACGSSQKHASPVDDISWNSPKRNPGSIPPVSSAPETQLLKKLMWPLARHKITQEFHEDGGRPHEGIDLAAPKGTRIYAPADGTVVYAGQKFHGYGKMIIIEHNDTLATLFGHCQKLLVKSGDVVKRGSLIGLVGRTGHATGSHLHFEVRVNRQPVDPLEYLP